MTYVIPRASCRDSSSCSISSSEVFDASDCVFTAWGRRTSPWHLAQSHFLSDFLTLTFFVSVALVSIILEDVDDVEDSNMGVEDGDVGREIEGEEGGSLTRLLWTVAHDNCWSSSLSDPMDVAGMSLMWDWTFLTKHLKSILLFCGNDSTKNVRRID